MTKIDIDKQVELAYHEMINDEDYSVFVKNRNKNEILPFIKKIIGLNKKDIFFHIEKNFQISQEFSKKLFRDANNSNTQDKFLSTKESIERANKGIFSKFKVILFDNDISNEYAIVFKNLYAELIVEKQKYFLIQFNLKNLLTFCFISEFLFKKMLIKQGDLDNDSKMVLSIEKAKTEIDGTKFSVASNLEIVDDFLLKNKLLTNSLLGYIQTISPKLFNEFVLKGINISNDNYKKYPKELIIKIDGINSIKEIANKKSKEFYRLDNIKHINKILKENENKSPSFVNNKLLELKKEMVEFDHSIKYLIQQLTLKTDDLRLFINDYSGEESKIIENIISDSLLINDSLKEISTEINNKIDIIFN